MELTFYDDFTGELCFPTSLASLLGVDPNTIPDFYRDGNESLDAWIEIQKFLDQFGLEAQCEDEPPKGWCLASGPSPRRVGFEHTCLAYNGHVVWDPCPTGQGLYTINDYIILISSTGDWV